MGGIDVERIRVPGERVVLAALKRDYPFVFQNYRPQAPEQKRRELMSRALLLTDTMAPEVYARARVAMRALALDDEIEIFQCEGRQDNARPVLYGRPIGIEFIGAYLSNLDGPAMTCVFGHEIGHCLAHMSHPEYGCALWGFGYPAKAAQKTYSMAAEFTADRFGLLACRDMAAVLRVEMYGAAGRPTSAIHFDTDAYLTQCRSVAEDTLARGVTAFGTSHPEHYIRGYAEWLFSESDLYAEITGQGPGSRSIDEVNAVVTRLLGRVASPTPPRDIYGRPGAASADVTSGDGATGKVSAPRTSLDDLATDILSDGARQKIAATGDLLKNVATSFGSSLSRFASAARSHIDDDDADEHRDEHADVDPLADDERDLLARFEELERKAKK
jgi:hypothetical protein